MVKRYTLEEAKQVRELDLEINKVNHFITNNHATEIAEKIVANTNICAPVSIKTIAEHIIKDHKEYLKNLQDELKDLGKEYKS